MDWSSCFGSFEDFGCCDGAFFLVWSLQAITALLSPSLPSLFSHPIPMSVHSSRRADGQLIRPHTGAGTVATSGRAPRKEDCPQVCVRAGFTSSIYMCWRGDRLGQTWASSGLLRCYFLKAGVSFVCFFRTRRSESLGHDLPRVWPKTNCIHCRAHI